MSSAISISHLGRIYKIRGAKKGEAKERVALADVNLEVPRGEFFGLLGPNGAGKTTLIKILTTLLAPSSGQALVAGYDVHRQPQLVRPRINMVSGGESSGYGLLTVRENLWMFGQFYGLDYKTTYARINALLERVGLTDRANAKTSDLSTGLRQKMNIARGFITHPEVIFLDEPTLGLDVGASRDVRHFIRDWVAEGASQATPRTMLLTTHYMAEAEELCARVAIINAGRLLACDSPVNLKKRLQRDALFHLTLTPIPPTLIETLLALPGVRKAHHTPGDGISTLDLSLLADEALSNVIAALTARQVQLLNLQKREPTLEDVFVELVGMSMSEAEKTE
jgi:ABC-2 type transport system ATP-binding protein